MTLIGCVLAGLLAAAPDSYLLRTAAAVESARGDVIAMRVPAEAVAARIAAGGALLASGHPALVSEVSGRAGGLMLITPLGERQAGTQDAVLHFAEAGRPSPEELAESGAACVAFGGAGSGDAHVIEDRSREWGLSPSLSMAIHAWLFTGELVAACTRLSKMPVLYESIGLYGGIPRQQRFQGQGIFWHEQHAVPPVDPGTLGNAYIDAVSSMLRRCEKAHRGDLDRAGRWAAASVRAGVLPVMYSMGHLFPMEIERTDMGKRFRSAVWNAGFTYHTAPDDTYTGEDTAIHIGYQHPPATMLERAASAGARAVYVSVYVNRDYPTSDTVIWIDPMWPFADACVAVSGYDVPALAASGVVNAAIAWEIYRCTERALAGAGK